MNLGKAIKLCRTRCELSQSELANIVGISNSYLSLLERGKRDPTLSTIEGIAKALDIPIIILIFLADDTDAIDAIYSLDQKLHEKLAYMAMVTLMKMRYKELS